MNVGKVVMQVLLALMLVIAVGAVRTQGWEEGLVLFAILAVSAWGYKLAEQFILDRDQEAYDRKMKAVQIFTMVCVVMSFYWLESFYYDIDLLICLIFHCFMTGYVKKAGWNQNDVKKGL